MFRVFICVCCFLLICITDDNYTLSDFDDDDDSTPPPARRSRTKSKRPVKPRDYTPKNADWGKEKYLGVIEFEDKFRCLGAIVKPKTLVTSNVCFDLYRFASKIRERPCKIYAGGKDTAGEDLGVWRYCLRADPSLWSNENLDYTKTGVSYINFDLPFDTIHTQIASIAKPDYRDSRECYVYGFGSKQNEQKTDSLTKRQIEINNNIITSLPLHSNTTIEPYEPFVKISKRDADGENESANKNKKGDDTVFKLVAADILAMDLCKNTYKENMDIPLPSDQFCVIEGGVEDQGRMLVCNKKVIGVVADDLAIKKHNNRTYYAYKYTNSTKILHPTVFLTLLTLHFLNIFV